MTLQRPRPPSMEERQLQAKIKIAKNLTLVWSRVKANVAKEAKTDADKEDRKALKKFFKTFDEGLTPKLKAVESAKDGPGYTKAVNAALVVVRSYQTKMDNGPGLKASHKVGLDAILDNIEDILEGKKTSMENGPVDALK
ncbi:MAG TPA: hypothetical protein PLG23_16860 [Thermoflexales bacterium]|nr:hypothetical protein [Anaerolineae bacterium]HQV29896.1 hypothetical protein [Thermoflexales bacterium]HQY25792.1 hypothetical protein [Thermoflexales bacterium]HQZ55137.1 hypothetical protein [Thermoflexales bacterium]HRA55677.1 hypothetical protein [Thermoflexales bacterium]